MEQEEKKEVKKNPVKKMKKVYNTDNNLVEVEYLKNSFLVGKRKLIPKALAEKLLKVGKVKKV
jgi:hypothetical protein